MFFFCRPFVGQVVDVKASLDLLSAVKLGTDAETGLPTVVVGSCSKDVASVSLTLLK